MIRVKHPWSYKYCYSFLAWGAQSNPPEVIISTSVSESLIVSPGRSISLSKDLWRYRDYRYRDRRHKFSRRPFGSTPYVFFFFFFLESPDLDRCHWLKILKHLGTYKANELELKWTRMRNRQNNALLVEWAAETISDRFPDWDLRESWYFVVTGTGYREQGQPL